MSAATPLEPHLPGLGPRGADPLDGASPEQAAGPPFRIDVIRSARRRKSYAARLVGGVLQVTIPSWMSVREEETAVREMTARFRRKLSAERIDLCSRMRALHRSHDLPVADEIRWSDDMHARWASCTPATSTIRVSTRIAAFPIWVVDYVLVHEMAHLWHSGHGPDFWAAVRVYPRTERAIGYLLAKSGDDSDGLDGDGLDRDGLD